MESITVPLPLFDSCVPLQLAWIPPGKFFMGNQTSIKEGTFDELEGTFEVVITKGYWLGIYPITQCQWDAVMNTNPSYYKGNNHPVGNISWDEAVKFCAQVDVSKLSLPDDYSCSLPTEAQWEYACCAGQTCKYQLGDSVEELDQVAWHSANTIQHSTQEVGTKAPNRWGLHDMLGNVREWCFDSQVDYPSGTSQVDWVGDSNPEFRNLRGGSSRTPPQSKDITCTGRFYGFGAMPWTGFRLCIRYSES